MQQGTIDAVQSDDDSIAAPVDISVFGGYFPFATSLPSIDRRRPTAYSPHPRSSAGPFLGPPWQAATRRRAEALKFWDEIAETSPRAAKVVQIFKDYNALMSQAGRPYRYG